METLPPKTLEIYEWLTRLDDQRPTLLNPAIPPLPEELAPLGSKPLELPAAYTFMYLRMAAHVIYEMSVLMSPLSDHSQFNTAFVLARTSLEAAGNAHHLASALVDDGDFGFLEEGLRESIWMSREGQKLPGSNDDRLIAAVTYARHLQMFKAKSPKPETDRRFAQRVSNERRMTHRVSLLFPEAPETAVEGFHYGFLSGYAHANPELYFGGVQDHRFGIAVGAALTALEAATQRVCEAMSLPYDDQHFDI